MATAALETVQLTRIIDKVRRPARFLTDTFFGQGTVLGTQTIQIGRRSRGRKTAPFVPPGNTALVVGGRERSEERITAPNIRIKTPINPSDLAYANQLNGNPFNVTDSGLNAQLSQHVGEVQLDLDAEIANAIEWMASKALFEGIITYIEVGKDAFTIDYQRPAGNTFALPLVDRWDGPTAFPEAQFSDAYQLVSDEEGVALTDCILGSEAAAAFLQNEGVQRRLDGRGFENGSLTTTSPFVEDGSVRFLGTMGPQIRVWTLVRSLEVQGVDTPLVDPKFAYFLSRNSSADQELYYAPIADDFDAYRASRASRALRLSDGGIAVRRFSKAWQSVDPTSLWVLMQSRPLPVVHRPAATVCMQVVS